MKWIGVLLFGICLSAQAEFKDGNQLLDDFDSDNIVNRVVGLGYVMGVADVGFGIVHCAPSNVKAGQIKDMVQNYLRNTPAERHLSADVTVNKVLKTVWPCQTRSRGNPA